MTTDNRSRVPAVVERTARRLINKRALSSTVTVGDSFRASPGSRVSSPGHLTIGHHACVGRNSLIDVSGTIGDYFLVAANVAIVGRQDHAINEVGIPVLLSAWVGDREPTSHDQITIGDDVWVGAGAVVLSGIRIGHASVIAAGAVVTKDAPDFAIVAGCPARVVGYRFDPPQGLKHLDLLGRL